MNKQVDKSQGISDWLTKNAPRFLESKFQFYVICGGKCGSCTLEKSFKEIGPTFRLHGKRHLDRAMKKEFPYTVMDLISFTSVPNKQIVIVNANREPVSRVMSSFFQNITNHLKKGPSVISQMSISDLIAVFKKEYLYTLDQGSGTAEWTSIGLDVYKHRFNKNKGYNVYRVNNMLFIDLLFDHINNWESIIRKETGYKNFVLITDNTADKKWYANIYKKFKREITFTVDEIDKMYGLPFWSKQLNYYYTQEQVFHYIGNWTECKNLTP